MIEDYISTMRRTATPLISPQCLRLSDRELTLVQVRYGRSRSFALANTLPGAITTFVPNALGICCTDSYDSRSQRLSANVDAREGRSTIVLICIYCGGAA